MARIRSTDTLPELTVRRFLHAKGLRFRLYRGSLPGKPDIVLPKYKVAINVNGCFWHGHSCKDGRRPKTNTGYWHKKLDRNLRRDEVTGQQLRSTGWKPIIVWACEARSPEVLERVFAEITS